MTVERRLREAAKRPSGIAASRGLREHFMTRMLIAVALALLAGPAGLAGCRQEPAAPRPLQIAEVEARMGKPGVHLYDANLRSIFDRYHLPGARWVSFDHVTEKDLPSDRQATLIFYCANPACSASDESAQQAMALGYRQVFVMPAGIYGWKRAGKPVESTR
jgi:rhodanese-related sulfurtransferase